MNLNDKINSHRSKFFILVLQNMIKMSQNEVFTEVISIRNFLLINRISQKVSVQNIADKSRDITLSMNP